MSNGKTVVVYFTSTCPYSKQVRDYLAERNIEFTEHDVVSDVKAREEMVHKSGQHGVPVIDVNGEIVIGFNRGKLDKLLA